MNHAVLWLANSSGLESSAPSCAFPEGHQTTEDGWGTGVAVTCTPTALAGKSQRSPKKNRRGLANEHVKRCSTPLVIRTKQTKPSIISHFAPFYEGYDQKDRL